MVTFPLAMVSQVFTRNELAFYAVIVNGTWIWTFLLFYISLKVLNDYSIPKAAAAYVISGVTMALTWLICLLGYVVTGRLYQFVDGIFQEIQMII